MMAGVDRRAVGARGVVSPVLYPLAARPERHVGRLLAGCRVPAGQEVAAALLLAVAGSEQTLSVRGERHQAARGRGECMPGLAGCRVPQDCFPVAPRGQRPAVGTEADVK